MREFIGKQFHMRNRRTEARIGFWKLPISNNNPFSSVKIKKDYLNKHDFVKDFLVVTSHVYDNR